MSEHLSRSEIHIYITLSMYLMGNVVKGFKGVNLDTAVLELLTCTCLSICVLSTPALHPEHTGNQEPQPSNPHFCSKHTHKQSTVRVHSTREVIH